MKHLSVFIFLLHTILLDGQMFRHYDYVGAGHQNEVSVTSSSSSSDPSITVDGFEVQNPDQLKQASRFLAQCTFGADYATIQHVAAMGMEAWLEEQFSLPALSYTAEMYEQSSLYGEEEGDLARPHFASAWTSLNMTSPDLVRQRMAFVLSQIFVINNNTDLFEDFGQLSSGYYDILYGRSFDNYSNLLMDVTLSPSMGLFLSHYGNPKADPEKNIHPDENYAREIMQLFSIGLWELNRDGTRKYDTEGAFIPTYSNADIKEFAQVFTGLSDGRPNGSFKTEDLEDDEDGIFILPMKMYESYHDDSEKRLLNGVVLPAGQGGMEDITQTINHLSTHPNTAPFIAKSLIRFFTTSNPSPQYVSRVVQKFDPTSEGNLKEVIKAILLDPEARTCTPTETYSFGKLKEPLLRYMNLMKAFQTSANENGKFPFEFSCLVNDIGQGPLRAPSVFNFFQPDYRPQSSIEWNYLVAPEFQILNSTTSIGVVNEMDKLAVQSAYFSQCEEYEDEIEEEEDFEESDSQYAQDYSTELGLIENPDALIERLNLLLAHGAMSEHTKSTIRTAMDQLDDPAEKLRMALYLVMISPDSAILK